MAATGVPQRLTPPWTGYTRTKAGQPLKTQALTADNPPMEGRGETTPRSRAGLSALRRHRKSMMPWSYVLFGVLLASYPIEALYNARTS